MKSRTRPTLGMVVLAAGFSRRLGYPKALATVRGMTLLGRTLRTLAPLAAAPRLVIAPPGSGRYRVGISDPTTIFVANRQRESGLGSSVRLGLRRTRYCSAVLLLPVDHPELSTVDLRRLIARWRASPRRVVARRIGSGAGSPLILPRWLFAAAGQTQGDVGLRDWLRRLPASALTSIRMPSAQADVDTPQDLARARGRGRHVGPAAPRSTPAP